jgi:hypothetical protein
MAEMGHERPKGDVGVESVRLPIADIGRRGPWVVFVPTADVSVGYVGRYVITPAALPVANPPAIS